MIHPDTELRFISDAIGYGVVATKPIPKGTITWVQDELDRIFTPEQEASLSPLMRECLDTYGFTNGIGNKVLCWDNAKFVNHSFNSNCMTTAYDFEIAIRDINPGEQLTDDYGYLNISEPFKAVDEGLDRKVVYPDDILKYHPQWDAAVAENLPLLKTIDQPLIKFLPRDTLNEINGVINGTSKLRSLLTCYHDPAKNNATII